MTTKGKEPMKELRNHNKGEMVELGRVETKQRDDGKLLLYTAEVKEELIDPDEFEKAIFNTEKQIEKLKRHKKELEAKLAKARSNVLTEV